MKIYETNYAVGKPYGSIETVNRNTALEYKRGTYTFVDGIVTLYAEPDYVNYTFVYKGRNYYLSLSELKKEFTDRQIMIRAGKFARQIVLNASL